MPKRQRRSIKLTMTAPPRPSDGIVYDLAVEEVKNP